MKSALFIGRFQPFHKGHLDIIKKILKDNDRIIIVIGSAEKNYIDRNPMTAGERFQTIDEALKEAKIPEKKYCIIPVRDVNNYALWVDHINIYVPPYDKLYTGSTIVKTCYEGKCIHAHPKSQKKLKIIQLERKIPISATIIRDAIVADKEWEFMVPKAIVKRMKEWKIDDRIIKIQNIADLSKYNNSY